MKKRTPPQVRRFIETAHALRDGTETCASITRLTSLKSLCKYPNTAVQFVAYLANKTFLKMQSKPCPKYTRPEDWLHYQTIAEKAVTVISQYIEEPNEAHQSAIRAVCREIEAIQDYSGREIWGRPVRTIYSIDVLVIEDAMRCIMDLTNASYWSYKTARDYAERFDSHTGAGLISESVPMLEDIIRFWMDQE